MSRNPISALLFIVAALYEAALGVLFLVWTPLPYKWFELKAPEQMFYAQAVGALLIVFAVMFLGIALSPKHNRGTVIYALLRKAALGGLGCYYWFTTGAPFMVEVFVIIEAVFLVLFAIALLLLFIQKEV